MSALAGFSREITCPKCGAGTPATRFVTEDKCGVIGPHLHLRCTSCEFGAGWNDWAVAPLDAKVPIGGI